MHEIANRLDVKEAEVMNMEDRLFSRDQSLNVQIADEANTEWQDLIADDVDTQDKIVEKKDEYIQGRKYFRFNKDEHIVRLHIGLEDPRDLINDLKNSLRYVK